MIFVWDSVTAEVKNFMKLPKGSRQVTALAFNKASTHIAAADLHNDHNVYLFRLDNNTMEWSLKSGPDKIFMLSWSLATEQFCTVGVKHIAFWEATSRKMKKGTFGSVDKQTNFACVTYDDHGIAYTGGQNGSIYKWNSGSLMSMHPLHKGVVHCIRFLSDPKDNSKVLLSGGADLFVNIINPENMTILTQVTVEAIPRSVDYSRFLLVGLRNGSIVELDL
jgi:hypothetical protein